MAVRRCGLGKTTKNGIQDYLSPVKDSSKLDTGSQRVRLTRCDHT